ncbi:hypothetical protein ACA910_004421 [Epithemia clementina (nom. ined.)]
MARERGSGMLLVEDADHYHEIGELDILCTKDKSISNHPGNCLFRSVIEDFRASYVNARDKATKMKITKDVLDCIRNEHGCRFLKFDSDLAKWVELSKVEARDKVGHALRFAIKRNNKIKTKTTTAATSSLRRQSSTVVQKRQDLQRRMSAEFSSEPLPSSPPTAPARRRSSIQDLADVISAAAAAAASAAETTANGRRGSFRASFSKKRGSIRASFTSTVGTQKRSSFTLSISMDKIQSARQNLDQIFQRQNELIQELNMELSTAACPPLMTSSSSLLFETVRQDGSGSQGMLNDYTEPYALDALSRDDETTMNLFSSTDLDFIIDDMEAV